MYVKTTTSHQNGKTYKNHYIAESYWDKDKQAPRNRNLANISDLPEEVIEQIKHLLSDEYELVSEDGVTVTTGDALCGAGQMALWRGWKKAQMDKILSAFSEKQIQSIKAMVFSRIVDPCSKLALKDHMADSFLARLFTKNRLDEDTLYEVMDKLEENFQSIQNRLRDLHQPEDPTLLLYDTTSTYFEGVCADEGEYGHSKDKRWDRYQIIVGVVTNQKGLPLAVEVFTGSTHDASTINDRIETLREEFGFTEVTFVGDSGTYGTDNIQTLRDAEFDYILSLAWKKQKKMLLELAPRQLKLFDKTGYHQWEEGDTRFVGCHSEAEKRRAQSRRKNAMKEARDQIKKWAQTAQKGAYYTPQRLREKVRQLLEKKGVKDLFVISINSLEEGEEEEKRRLSLEYDIDRIALRERKVLEGKYILQTTLSKEEKSAQQIEDDYKRLQEVERGFRHIKSYLKIRPIYHWRDRRVRAHVLICFLAYFLVKWMEGHLREAGEGREVERVIRKWDQLKLVHHRVRFDGYESGDWSWSRGEVGEEVVDQIKEVGWWQSIQSYKHSITKQLQDGS